MENLDSSADGYLDNLAWMLTTTYADAVTTAATDYVEAATRSYRARLLELVETAGVPSGDAADTGRRAAALTASAALWDQLIGPLWPTEAVRARLGGVSRQAIDDRVRHRSLLALRTAGGRGGGRLVFPAWQLDGAVLDPLPELLRAVGYDPDRTAESWMLASWLCTPDVQLDGQRPRDLLAAGQIALLHPLLAEVRAELAVADRAAVQPAR